MAFHLRPMTIDDLPLLTGGDAEFDELGDEAASTRREEPSPSTLSEDGELVVCDDDEVLGDVGWHWVQWGATSKSRNPMIGIWLRRSARGRGVGTWAQRELVGMMFEALDINRVEAHTDVANVPEQRALEAAGFSREGIVRGAQWRAGTYRDGYLYSVLRNDAAQATTHGQDAELSRRSPFGTLDPEWSAADDAFDRQTDSVIAKMFNGET